MASSHRTKHDEVENLRIVIRAADGPNTRRIELAPAWDLYTSIDLNVQYMPNKNKGV